MFTKCQHWICKSNFIIFIWNELEFSLLCKKSNEIIVVINYNYLDGLIIPEASLRIVSLVFSAKLIPTQLKADSAMFLAALGSEGRALSPI